MHEHLNEYNSQSVSEMIGHVRAVVARRAVQQRAIVVAIGVEKSQFSRWLNGKSKWSRLKPEAYRKLVEFMVERNLIQRDDCRRPILDAITHSAFHGMVQFLGCTPDAINRAREKLEGHYAGYRFSYSAAPDILKGALTITYDHEAKALTTQELFKIPADVLGSGSAEISFRRKGYIWPTMNGMYLMISEKLENRDIQVVYLNKSLLNALTHDVEALHTVEGVLLDWQGPDFYMTKIFLQKLKAPLAENEIGLFSERQIPGPVLSKLRDRFIGPHQNLRVYK